MIVSPRATVGEIAARFPQSIRVLQRLRIEFCCDGDRELGELCRERNMSFDELAAALTAAANSAPLPRHDWNTRPLSELTAHLVDAFHEPLREELPRLCRMARKVQRHRDPYRYVLAVVLHELERAAALLSAARSVRPS